MLIRFYISPFSFLFFSFRTFQILPDFLGPDNFITHFVCMVKKKVLGIVAKHIERGREREDIRKPFLAKASFYSLSTSSTLRMILEKKKTKRKGTLLFPPSHSPCLMATAWPSCRPIITISTSSQTNTQSSYFTT